MTYEADRNNNIFPIFYVVIIAVFIRIIQSSLQQIRGGLKTFSLHLLLSAFTRPNLVFFEILFGAKMKGNALEIIGDA